MPGFLPVQVGARVIPQFGSSPVEDDPLFGDAGSDTIPFQAPTDEFTYTPGEVNGEAFPENPQGLQPVSGLNALDPQKADTISRDPRFNTALGDGEAGRYDEWKRINAPNDSGYDYDLVGAFKAGVTRDPASGHMPDTFKKPNHPTFSEQSQYAQYMPELAGGWEGPDQDVYVPAAEWQKKTGISYTPAEADSLTGASDFVRGEFKPGNMGGPAGFGVNMALQAVYGAANFTDLIGTLLEAYGDPVLMRAIGGEMRAAGQDVGKQVVAQMGDEWRDAMEKSWRDFTSNGAIRDPRAWLSALSQQLLPLATARNIALGAEGALAIAGLTGKTAAAGGWAVAGAVSSAGDATQSAMQAVEQAGGTPEQARHAGRVAGMIGGAAGVATGPILGKVISGEAGSIFGKYVTSNLGKLATGVGVAVGEQVAEEGLTQVGAEIGKTTVGLPFDWGAVAESMIQGGAIGGPLGARGAVIEHQRGKAERAQEAQLRASQDAEQAAIKSEVDRINAENRQKEEEKQAQAAATPIPPYPTGATPPSAPAEATGAVGAGADFLSGMDPSIRASPEAEAANLRGQVAERLTMLGHQMVVLEDMIQQENDPTRKKELVDQFKQGKTQIESLKAEYALYPAPPLPMQGSAETSSPSQQPLMLPAPRVAPEPDLAQAQALSALYSRLSSLQNQILQTRQPDARRVLIEQFRNLNQQATALSAQMQQGADFNVTTPESAAPDATVSQSVEQNRDLPRLPPPTTQELMGDVVEAPTARGGVFVASTEEGRVQAKQARQQERVTKAAQLQREQIDRAVDKLVPTIQATSAEVDRLKKMIDESTHAPTRARMVGRWRKAQEELAGHNAELEDLVRRRDQGPVQLPLPGLDTGRTGTAGGVDVDYAALSRDLDRMLPPVGRNARPVAPASPTAPREVGPIAEIFDRWVKKSQAARKGAETKAAKKLQAARDAGTAPDPAQDGEPGPSQSDTPVRLDGTPNSNPPPEPAPLADLSAASEGAGGPTASMGAELGAIRTKFPSRRPTQAEPVETAPPGGLGAPSGTAEQAPPTNVPSRTTPSVRASQGLPGPIPDPVEAEAAKRNQPLTQPEFVTIATSLNQTKAQVEAQMPPRQLSMAEKVEKVVEDELAQPDANALRVARDYTHAFGGSLQEALNYVNWVRNGKLGMAMNPPGVELATTSTKKPRKPRTPKAQTMAAEAENRTEAPQTTGEETLADPNSPLYKVPEDADQPTTGVLEAAFQLEQADPATSEAAARSPRNVLARLLSDGPVRVDTVLAHLRANLDIDPNSQIDRLMQRLAGAFPASKDNPTKVVVENRQLTDGFQGLYDPKADTIYIDLQQAADPFTAVLHEMVHAAVIVRMGNIGFQEQMNRFAYEAKKRWVDNKLLPRYNELRAFQNANEFITEALTNSWFSQTLGVLHDADYDKAQTNSTLTQFKRLIAKTLGFQPKTPERAYFDQLLEFIPDSDFLKDNPNRETILASLDRMGLANANALMSLSAAMLHVRHPIMPAGNPPPRGRTRDALVRIMLGNQLANTYGKLGQSFLNRTTGLVESLSDSINKYFRLQNARNGYAKEQLHKSSQIVELFKDAATSDQAGRLGEIMVRSRMYGLDASKPLNDPANLAGARKPGSAAAYGELQNMWNSLHADPVQKALMQDVYELVRDHGDEIRYGKMTDLMVQRMRSMVGDAEADALSSYIASRSPIQSAVGAKHRINLGYHPILTAAEIDAQVNALVPANNPTKQAAVAKALKEVHKIMLGTVGPYFPLRRYGKYISSFKSDASVRVMSRPAIEAMVAADRADPDAPGTLMIDSMVPTGAGSTHYNVTFHHEQFETSDTESEGFERHDEIKAAWQRAAARDGRRFNSKAAKQRDQVYDAKDFANADIESLRKTLEAALGAHYGPIASDEALQWFMEKSPATSVRKSMMGARLVSGASTDMLRAYSEYAQGTAYQRAQIKYDPQMHRTLSQDLVRDAAHMEKNGAREQANDLTTLGNELQRRQEFQVDRIVAERNHENWLKLWQQAPQLAYVFMLTGTGTMVVNSMQPIQVGLPYLGARYGFIASGAALASAYRDTMQRGGKGIAKDIKRAVVRLPGALQAVRLGLPTPSIRNPHKSHAQRMIQNLPQSEQDIANELARLGKIDYGMVADIQSAVKARSQGTGLVAKAGKAADLFGYLSEAAFIAPQAIETQNRIAMAIAEFRLMKVQNGIADNATVANGGMTQDQFDQMVATIGNSIDQTMVNYERDNKPPIMQHEGLKAALVFKHYAVQQWYNITHNFLQGFMPEQTPGGGFRYGRGETEEARRQARAFLGAWTATTMLTTGAAGIVSFEPIYVVACALMAALGSDDKDPEEALRTSMGEWNDSFFGQVMRKGVPYAAGVDMSRMGLSQLFPAEEAWGLYNDPQSSTDNIYTFMGKLIGGAPASMLIDNIGRGSLNILEGNFSKGAEQLAPKAFMLNDVIRAMNYASTGMTTRSGQTRVEPEDISLADKAIRILGFQPSSLTEVSDYQFATKRRSQMVKADKYDLIDSYAEAAMEGRDVTSILQKIVKFNQDYPLDGLTKETLLRAVKRRVEDAAELKYYGTTTQGRGDRLRALEMAPDYQLPSRETGIPPAAQ